MFWRLGPYEIAPRYFIRDLLCNEDCWLRCLFDNQMCLMFVSFLKMLCLTIFITMIKHSKGILDLCPMSELTRVSSDLGVSVTFLILMSLS